MQKTKWSGKARVQERLETYLRSFALERRAVETEWGNFDKTSKTKEQDQRKED